MEDTRGGLRDMANVDFPKRHAAFDALRATEAALGLFRCQLKRSPTNAPGFGVSITPAPMLCEFHVNISVAV